MEVPNAGASSTLTGEAVKVTWLSVEILVTETVFEAVGTGVDDARCSWEAPCSIVHAGSR